MSKEREIFELHAETCKALSNPLRLQILNVLSGKELTVGEIVTATGATKSNVSQHLALLKRLGILKSKKQGKKVICNIADDRIMEACMLMRDFLMSRLKKNSELLGLTKQGGAS